MDLDVLRALIVSKCWGNKLWEDDFSLLDLVMDYIVHVWELRKARHCDDEKSTEVQNPRRNSRMRIVRLA